MHTHTMKGELTQRTIAEVQCKNSDGYEYDIGTTFFYYIKP